MTDTPDAQDPRRKKSAFRRSLHSIRTRYSFWTALLLLAVLGMFYVGGRIVLVHFMREAQGQVKDIGFGITRLINREGERTCRTAAALARLCAADPDGVLLPSRGPRTVAGLDADVALVCRIDAAGRPLTGWTRAGAAGGSVAVSAKDFGTYLESLAGWTRSLPGGGAAKGIGIIRLGQASLYCAIVRLPDGSSLVVGTPFDPNVFSARVNASLSGMDVRVETQAARLASMRAEPAPKKVSFGLVPMVTEAFNFYTGGFWEFGSGPAEAAFTVRDMAGRPVTLLVVSLPRTFAGVTSSALGRLTFAIALIGLLFVAPLFWLQNRILLNPLSKMIARTKEIGEHHNDIDCPRVEWEGDDEFAQLAVSLNMMLETISRRALAVAQSESRQRALIGGMEDGLVIFDPLGRVVSVVKAPDGMDNLPGFTEGSTLDPAVWGGESLKSFGILVASVFSSGEVGRLHMTTVGTDETCRHFEFRVSRMDGHFALAVVRDTTQETAERYLRRRAEERLARMGKQESMTLFAAGIAHDVNNVLATVLNTVEGACADVADPTVLGAADSIRDAVGRGRAMMRELMTYAGETKIALKRVSPATILADARRLLQNAAGAGRIPLVCDVPDDLPCVDADATQIWKVFFNLVKNAAEAVGNRAGQVTVRARPYRMTAQASVDFHAGRPLPPGDGVLFDVSDDGTGMSQDLVRRIFDPYVSSKAAGRGLGLAIVASIVDAHGGGISVESAPTKGTTFHVYLPVSKLPVSVEATPVSQSSEPTAAQQKRDVLIVDDDMSILKTTAILVKSLGYIAHLAKDNQEAMDIVRRRAEDLLCVLLDAHLDQTDAVRLMGQIRSTNARVPVVVVSGSTQETVDELFADYPHDGFLAKPYTRDELATALMTAAKGRHRAT